MFDMAQQHTGSAPGPISASSTISSAAQFVDTTYTKVFVGGLAWETQRDTMRRHFEQYGEIIEAVVITDKNTGRSKGYGFVTFREPEAARRACADATPVIDGRRANCNLASLGAHRSRPAFTAHGNRFRIMAPIPASPHPGGAVYMGGPSFPQVQCQYAFQHGFPYQTYGYSSYSPEFGYQPGLYNPYGGPQYPQIYTNSATIASSAMYPYMQFSQPLQAGYPSQGYSVQLPQVMQYGAAASVATVTTPPQQYGGIVPLPTPVTSSGVTLTYSSATGAGNPGPSPPPQIFAVQQQYPQGAAISEQSSGTPVVTNLDGTSTFQSDQGDTHRASSSQLHAPTCTNVLLYDEDHSRILPTLVGNQA